MSGPHAAKGTKRNERLVLSSDDISIIEAAYRSFEERRGKALERLHQDQGHEMAKASVAETRSLLAEAIPDFAERAERYRAQHSPGYQVLKGDFPFNDDISDISKSIIVDKYATVRPKLRPWWTEILDLTPVQPPGVREFWWADTHWGVTAPNNTVSIDISGDPYRLWGHIGYGGDPLMSGSAGLVMNFILSPERLPFTDRTRFEVRPTMQTGGWVSGWTGHYHPIWAADDKWSKLWAHRRFTLRLSTGELLDEEIRIDNRFFLENVNPVGQANVSEFEAWVPILHAALNTADLRARGVSLVLTAELRFDWQLEGESDLWFRNRPGSAQDSTPGFDNSITFRCLPGVLTDLP